MSIIYTSSLVGQVKEMHRFLYTNLEGLDIGCLEGCLEGCCVGWIVGLITGWDVGQGDGCLEG